MENAAATSSSQQFELVLSSLESLRSAVSSLTQDLAAIKAKLKVGSEERVRTENKTLQGDPEAVRALKKYFSAQVAINNLTEVHRNFLVLYVEAQTGLDGGAWFADAIRQLMTEGVVERAGKPQAQKFRAVNARTAGRLQAKPEGDDNAPPQLADDPHIKPDASGHVVQTKTAELDEEGQLESKKRWQKILEIPDEELDKFSGFPRNEAIIFRQVKKLEPIYNPACGGKTSAAGISWAHVEWAAAYAIIRVEDATELANKLASSSS